MHPAAIIDSSMLDDLSIQLNMTAATNSPTYQGPLASNRMLRHTTDCKHASVMSRQLHREVKP